jgi:ADP-ribose pyrophosphatase
MEKWKVEDSRIVLDASPFVRLRQDRCVLPNGLIIPDYNIVEEPNIVTIFALTPQKELLLVEQYKHGIGEICLELVGGLMDREEPFPEAQRELLEETGYGSSQWLEGGCYIINPTRQPNRMYHFIALDAEKVAEQNLDSTEAIRLQLMPIAEVQQAIVSGRIAAVHSIAAIYRSLSILGTSLIR